MSVSERGYLLVVDSQPCLVTRSGNDAQIRPESGKHLYSPKSQVVQENFLLLESLPY